MKINEIKVKSILSKSGIYGIDYSINPYRGCAHGCTYCYARFTHICRGGDPRDWGQFVNVKINAPQVLKRELTNAKKGNILISSVTDPYQALEGKYELTRKILEISSRKQFPVVILTKSPLVTRDIDLLKKFRYIEVGLTITTLKESIREIFEPNAPKIESRLNALGEIVEAGIPNYAFIAPLLPVISLNEIKELILEFKELGVDRVMVDKLNIKAKNWITINDALERYYPDKKDEFWRKARSPVYWDRVRKYLVELSKNINIRVDILF